jgi:NAD(P)H-flavin reductase
MEFGRMTVIYGARNPSSILFKEEIARLQENLGTEFHLTVDQPGPDWNGRTGTLLQPLREVVTYPGKSLVVASVGPASMYRFVAVELLRKGMNERQLFFSLERRFKCGIGKCGHCQLNDYYVCVDGPVFRYSQLMGRPEAIEVWAPEKDRDRVGR